MEIAIAEVAKYIQLVFADGRAQVLAQSFAVLLHFLNRQGNIENNREPAVQHLFDVVTQLPEMVAVGFRLGDGRIDDQAGLIGGFHRVVEALCVEFEIRSLAFHQHIVGVVLGDWRVALGRRRRDQPVELLPHHLKSRQRAAQGAVHMSQKAGEMVKVVQPDKGHVAGYRLLPQSQHQPRDDSQGSLGTHEQLFQVIARVVLDQVIQRGHHRAIRQHRLHAQHHIAHHAVADYPVAAGVGGGVAAQGRRAAGTQVQREHQLVFLHRLLQGLQGDSRLHGGSALPGVDLLDGTHALQRQDDLVRRRVAAVDQSREATLGDHHYIVGVAPAKDPGYFFGTGRSR